MTTGKNIHQKINARSNASLNRIKDGRPASNRLVQLVYTRDLDYWKTAPYIALLNSRNYLREDIN